MKRYEWEDALIQAQVDGLIPNGALLLALKLSKAINWAPRRGRKAGLYWANNEALEAVGAGRSTYFKHKDVLFEQGFFTMERQNLIPTLPDQSTVETEKSTPWTEESTVETNESTPWTDQSTVWTEESTGEHPFTVDTFSEDTLSEDVCSEENKALAGAPASDKTDSTSDDQPSLITEGIPEKFFYKGKAPVIAESNEGGAVMISEEGSAESTPWTEYAQLAEKAGVKWAYDKLLAVPTAKGRQRSPRACYLEVMKKAGKEVSA